MKQPPISIIIPTLNEEKNLPRVLESIKKVDYPSENIELVIVDGGSKDKTLEIAKRFGAKVYHNQLKVRGAGCKIGVEKAKGEYVAFTDADCVVPPHWLNNLFPYLNNHRIAAVGGPNITPEDDSPFAKAAGEALSWLTKLGSRYGYQGKKVTEIYHNPGCNVLYQKAAILKAGNFNPNLLTCEDEELDFRIRSLGYSLLFTPKVIVDHYRRLSYKKIFVQAYRFAIGRVQAIKLHPRMARWFHFIPSLLLFSIIGLLPVLIIFLLLSLFLSQTKKLVPFYVYWAIFCLWFSGWGLGFLSGIFIPFSLKSE